MQVNSARHIRSLARPGLANKIYQDRIRALKRTANLGPADCYKLGWKKELEVHPLDPRSIFRRPHTFFDFEESNRCGITDKQRADALHQAWHDFFTDQKHECDRTLRGNNQKLQQLKDAAEKVKVPANLMEDQFAVPLHRDYVDTYTFGFSLTIAHTQYRVWDALSRLHKYVGHIPPLRKEVLTEKARRFETVGKVKLVTYDKTREIVDVVDHYRKALRKLLELHTEVIKKNPEAAEPRSYRVFPAGPDYNRGQTALYKAAQAVIELASKHLPEDDKISGDLKSENIFPYINPVAPKPSKWVKFNRTAKTFNILNSGGQKLRGLHLLKNPSLPTLTWKDLRASNLPLKDHWYRLYFDMWARHHARAALTRDLSGYGKPGESILDCLASILTEKGQDRSKLNFDNTDFMRAKRYYSGSHLNEAGGLNVKFEYAPHVKEALFEYVSKFRAAHARLPRGLIVPTHTGTSDEYIFLQAIAHSDFDFNFGRQPSIARIIARPDYDKNLPIIRSANCALDQEALMGVTFFTEENMKPLVRLAKEIREQGIWALLFPVGGRDSRNNPFVQEGLRFLIEKAEIDIITPLKIPNSTGEEFRGGESTVIAQEPIIIRDHTGDRIKFDDKHRMDPLQLDQITHALWWLHKDGLMKWNPTSTYSH